MLSHLTDQFGSSSSRQRFNEETTMRLLRVDTSVRTRASASRTVGDAAERRLRLVCPELVVVRRDLGACPLPAVWTDALGAKATPNVAGYLAAERPVEPTESTQAGVRLAEELASELLTADALLFTVPMYNFGVPYQLKQWVDLVIVDPRAADTNVPILAGKAALVVLAKGGAYGPGTPRAGSDHAGPWLHTVLETTWGLSLTVVDLELTMAAHDPAMRELVPLAERIRTSGEQTARRWADGLCVAP
jgi:FMN-dependent NADH-azoreductase